MVGAGVTSRCRTAGSPGTLVPGSCCSLGCGVVMASLSCVSTQSLCWQGFLLSRSHRNPKLHAGIGRDRAGSRHFLFGGVFTEKYKVYVIYVEVHSINTLLDSLWCDMLLLSYLG